MAFVGLLALSGQVFGVTGTIDDVPAATLLLPYFAVDLDDPEGVTTLFSINNASAAPTIAHVVLWTDKSVPTLDFNVYLTGYDVVTVNLRDVFNGTVPQTDHDDLVAGPAIGPTTSNSNYGLFSLFGPVPPSTAAQGAGNICDAQLPTGPLPAILINHITAAHTGGPSSVFGGLCSGTDRGNNLAIGYITVDNVNDCTLFSPQDGDNYWGTGTGPNNVNQLWGDYFYIDVGNDFAQGETLVHVEADGGLGLANYTFYRRYNGAASDQREGLPTTHAVRYLAGGVFSGGTSLAVWRDSHANQGPFDCANPFGAASPDPPFWQPLGQDQIVIFDEEENPEVPQVFPFSPPIGQAVLIPFPEETQLTEVGGPAFPVPFTFGWLYLNLNTTLTAVAEELVPFSGYHQSWVTAIMSALGRFSVGFDSVVFDNATFGVPTLVTAPPRTSLCLGQPAPAGPGAVLPCP